MRDTLMQLNVRLPAELLAKVKTDAARFHIGIETATQTILAEWFKSWTLTEREKFYPKRAKTIGRPIKTLRK